jgi:hypothetical protein
LIVLETIPNGHPLEGVRLKLTRAEEHLVMLDSQIFAFLQDEPYTVSYERKPDGSEHVYKVHVAERMPADFGVIVGDCLQNMRSALDHLVWQLAIRSGKRTETPARQTAFPVCDTRDAFRAKGTKNKVADLTAEDRARIESLQPFQAGVNARNHWLWHLNELSRIDRHQVLHPVGAIQDTIDIRVGKRDEHGNFVVIPLGQLQPDMGMNVLYAPFEDGAEIVRFTLNLSNPDPEMEMDCEFSFVVTFGEGVTPGFPHTGCRCPSKHLGPYFDVGRSTVLRFLWDSYLARNSLLSVFRVEIGVYGVVAKPSS